ncbi:MAG: hypothetical protein HY399_06900 [Elusimicrobia bacterium]|nr:hypothetical protein [Elusimicrobiota bacterium]
MQKKWMMLVAGICLCLCRMGWTDEPPTPKTEPPKTEDSAKPSVNEAQREKMAALAKKYNVPETDVQTLRDKKMGWGEIGHALAIAQKSGKPLSEITALRDSGMGWGEIAKKYGFKLGEIVRKAKKIERDGMRAEKIKHETKPHSPGNSHLQPHGSMGHGGGHGKH